MSEPSIPQIGVGAVVIRNGKVLLVKRGRPPSEGLWAIPGGRLQFGETLQQGAERELLEETGIVIRATNPIYIFDVLDKDETGGVRYHYVIVDLAAEYVTGEVHASDDAVDARWLSADDLTLLSVSEKTIELLRDIVHFIP